MPVGARSAPAGRVRFGEGARPAAIDEDANYAIEVTNPMPHAMNVSLNLGTGITALGAVEPNQTRRFEIRNPGTNDIELVATAGAGGHTVRKKVELSRTTVARVNLSQ